MDVATLATGARTRCATSGESRTPGEHVEAEILTPQEAADLLRFTTDQLYELTRERSRSRQRKPIPVCRVGKFLRFRRSSLLAWLSELENAR